MPHWSQAGGVSNIMAENRSAQELLIEFHKLLVDDVRVWLTSERMMIINRYLMQATEAERNNYIFKFKLSNIKVHAELNKIKEKLYRAAKLNMEAYRAIIREDSTKTDIFRLAYLEPHQDYGEFYTRVGMVRPFSPRDLLNHYEATGYDTAFIAWTDPELFKVVAIRLMLGEGLTDVAKSVNRSVVSLREVNNQLMMLNWVRPTPKFKDSFNYIGHFLTKLINRNKFNLRMSASWNYVNATNPVKQPDLYFPYTGYRVSIGSANGTSTLFEGVTNPSYAFYRCINPATGEVYTDRAYGLPLFFCPQSSVMHYNMDVFIDLMQQVLKPNHKLDNIFIDARLDSFLGGTMQEIRDNHDENLFQSPGNTVTYILALLGRFPERITKLDPRRELGVVGELTKHKWLTDPRLKYLLVYQYFQSEVINGRPTFRGVISKGSSAADIDITIAKRELGASQVEHTPKYDPYKYHADRSDEDTLSDLGDSMQRNLGGKTVVKLFNGVWEDEIVKHTIWDVCTKHSLIEFSSKMYRARVDATKNIMNKSYIRPGLTHRPHYLDMPLRLKDLLPKLNINKKRVHNIFNYVLKYHVEKNSISPFKTNFCQIEEKPNKIVITAGLNRLNLTHLQWIAILEHLRIQALLGNIYKT